MWKIRRKKQANPMKMALLADEQTDKAEFLKASGRAGGPKHFIQKCTSLNLDHSPLSP